MKVKLVMLIEPDTQKEIQSVSVIQQELTESMYKF